MEFSQPVCRLFCDLGVERGYATRQRPLINDFREVKDTSHASISRGRLERYRRCCRSTPLYSLTVMSFSFNLKNCG